MTPILLKERRATFKRIKVDVEAALTTIQTMANIRGDKWNPEHDSMKFIIHVTSAPDGLLSLVKGEDRLWNGLERVYPELWPHFTLDGEKLQGIEYSGKLDAGLTKLYKAGIEAISNDEAHHHPERPSFHGYFVKASDELDARRILFK
jgi:hypothetical protein